MKEVCYVHDIDIEGKCLVFPQRLSETTIDTLPLNRFIQCITQLITLRILVNFQLSKGNQVQLPLAEANVSNSNKVNHD